MGVKHPKLNVIVTMNNTKTQTTRYTNYTGTFHAIWPAWGNSIKLDTSYSYTQSVNTRVVISFHTKHIFRRKYFTDMSNCLLVDIIY